jgi:hypothetical protein
VVVRVRPLLPAERDSKDKAAREVCVSIEPTAAGAGTSASASVSANAAISGQAGVVTVREPIEDSFGVKHTSAISYGFDACYDSTAPTRALFDNELRPYLKSALWSGHSVTVFCYGMTGTGKTHTYVLTP